MNATFILSDEKARERIAKRIAAMPLDGELHQVIVKPYEKRRTVQQNARLHLIFAEVAKATGADIESVKLGYKAKFLPGKEAAILGRTVTVYPKTSAMTVQQLNDFMFAVETHAIEEFGVLLGENEYAYG